MRSSSILKGKPLGTAHLALIAASIAFSLSYFPVFLTPDALAQTVALPLPAPSSALSSAFDADSNAALLSDSNVSMSPQGGYPRLVIPAINLNDPIIPVGIDSTGALAVPSGKTNEIGWYQGGPQPGNVGSAVLDAHVFAAFSKLHELKTGDNIYIEMSSTETLHFVVASTKDFALSKITPQDLFVPTTDHDLNLITCAGKLTPDHSTYDHRFVVYATLAD